MREYFENNLTIVNVWECYTFAGAAEALGVAVWRLRYAVESGYLPRPTVRFKRRALFAPGQIEWMRAYFSHRDDGIARSPEHKEESGAI